MGNIIFNYYFFFFMLFLEMILIIKFKNMFLMILISIEFIIILNISMTIYLKIMNYNEWLFLFYIVFSICESVFGLALMINLMYKYGNQNISMMNLMW